MAIDPKEFKFAQLRRHITHGDEKSCMLCSQKIAAKGTPDAVHEGFRFVASDYWVCAPCFSELGAYFDWSETEQSLPGE